MMLDFGIVVREINDDDDNDADDKWSSGLVQSSEAQVAFSKS